MSNRMKVLALGLMTAFSSVAVAQSNDNDAHLVAVNDIETTSHATKTMLTENKKDALTPAVREGGYMDAMYHSYDNKLLVVYISGAKGTEENPERYTAKQYAEILQKAFGNSKYTDNPTDIVVFYNETGEDGPSTAAVLINGDKYKTKSGRVTFTPMIVGNAIDTFADAYAKTKGIVSHTPTQTDFGQSLALNNN